MEEFNAEILCWCRNGSWEDDGLRFGGGVYSSDFLVFLNLVPDAVVYFSLMNTVTNPLRGKTQ